MLVQSYKAYWQSKDKILFRFLFSYFILYIVFLFSSALFETPFRWIGSKILGFNWDYEISGNGSGDHSYAYITLFMVLILSLISSFIWSLADRKRPSYNSLFYWFTLILRIFLICAMLLYGFVKVFQIQFQPPTFLQLLQPLGEFSPMGLAWTYMGFSKAFGMFAGLVEVFGGILLIWRRTSTLGALIIIGVMAQVAMMNFSFDIPVKLFSIHLILMAGVLVMTDAKRLTGVFIKNKAVSSYEFYYPYPSKMRRESIANLKKILVPLILVIASVLGFLGELNISDKNHRPSFYGVWEVDLFIKGSDTLAPVINDENRWRYLIIQRQGSAFTKSMNDQITRYNFVVDTLVKKISIFKQNQPADSLNVNYHYTKGQQLHLQGSITGSYYDIQLHKKDMDSLPLTSRGFHWINESPFVN